VYPQYRKSKGLSCRFPRSPDQDWCSSSLHFWRCLRFGSLSRVFKFGFFCRGRPLLPPRNFYECFQRINWILCLACFFVFRVSWTEQLYTRFLKGNRYYSAAGKVHWLDIAPQLILGDRDKSHPHGYRLLTRYVFSWVNRVCVHRNGNRSDHWNQHWS